MKYVNIIISCYARLYKDYQPTLEKAYNVNTNALKSLDKTIQNYNKLFYLDNYNCEYHALYTAYHKELLNEFFKNG